MKNILKNSAIGIGIALVIFLTNGILIDFSNQGCFSLTDYSFSKMVLGTLLVGIGFGAPAAVYNSENLSLPLKTIIHMGIGCTVYTITAFLVGWIPTGLGIKKCILLLLCGLTVSFLIWLGFLLHYKKMARKMNAKIQQLNK